MSSCTTRTSRGTATGPSMRGNMSNSTSPPVGRVRKRRTSASSDARDPYHPGAAGQPGGSVASAPSVARPPRPPHGRRSGAPAGRESLGVGSSRTASAKARPPGAPTAPTTPGPVAFGDDQSGLHLIGDEHTVRRLLAQATLAVIGLPHADRDSWTVDEHDFACRGIHGLTADEVAELADRPASDGTSGPEAVRVGDRFDGPPGGSSPPAGRLASTPSITWAISTRTLSRISPSGDTM